MVGDADSSGTALNVKWSATEYGNAINFAIEMLRERYLLPTYYELTWTADTYEYTPTSGALCYVHTIKAEATTDGGGQSPSAGTGLYEYLVSNSIVSVHRSTSTPSEPALHFDKNRIQAHGLNINGLKMRLFGYKYQPALSGGSDVLYIHYPSVLLVAKQYLHLSAEGRDNASLMKHARQWQLVASQLAQHNEEDWEQPGGFWLT